MRNAAHPLLSPLAISLWSIAAMLLPVLAELPERDRGAARAAVGLIVLLTGVGIAAVICRAIELSSEKSAQGERDAGQQLLLEALLEECPMPDPHEPQVCRLRREPDAA